MFRFENGDFEFRNQMQRISIYPNPCEGELNFKLINSSYEEIKIEIYSLYGKLNKEFYIRTSEDIFTKRINLSGLTNGIYLVTLRSENLFHTFKVTIII